MTEQNKILRQEAALDKFIKEMEREDIARLDKNAKWEESTISRELRWKEEARDKKIDRMLGQTVVFVMIIMVIGVYKLLS